METQRRKPNVLAALRFNRTLEVWKRSGVPVGFCAFLKFQSNLRGMETRHDGGRVESVGVFQSNLRGMETRGS